VRTTGDAWSQARAGRRAAPAGVARTEHLREHNLSVALGFILDAAVPPSRAELATGTGLARPSVTPIVEQLIRGGMVRELVPRPSLRAGRPAVPLAPAQGTFAGLGMEVNVDYLGLRAIDLSGQVLVERVEADDLRRQDPALVLGRLAGIAARTLRRLRVEGVRVVGTSLALPGLVDSDHGPLRLAPNLDWRDVDVVGILRAHGGLDGLLPSLANEAKLGARAEARVRRSDGPPSFVYVSGEIGVGGALVLDGEIFAGRHGWSGEIGHVVVDPSAAGGPARGTLEARAGQEAMLRGAGLPPTATVHDLAAAVDRGDPRARFAVASAARALGVALAGVLNTVDVDEVVLGGTFGQLFAHVHDDVERALDEMVITAPWSAPRVTHARAGQFAAMTGGALAALRRLVAAPSPWFPTNDELPVSEAAQDGHQGERAAAVPAAR
jgi:predicted NBD/HSP70 family sugar kinase